jgi:hypothetical protein
LEHERPDDSFSVPNIIDDDCQVRRALRADGRRCSCGRESECGKQQDSHLTCRTPASFDSSRGEASFYKLFTKFDNSEHLRVFGACHQSGDLPEAVEGGHN